MIRERLLRMADRLRTAAAESRLLSGRPPKTDELGSVADGSFHRGILRESETGVLLRWFRAARTGVLSASLRSFGVFLLAWGIVSILVLSVGEQFDAFNLRFGIPLATAISALPLCFSGKMISEELTGNFLTGNFLLGFCKFSISLFEAEPRRERILYPLFAGTAIGSLSVFFHPIWFPLLLLFSFIFLIGLAVPETTVFPIVLAFPFLGFFPHPSLLLGVFCLFSIVCWLPKVLSGHRQYRFLKLDIAVLLFAAILTLGGAVNAAGSDGAGPLLTVYLLAAWFPVRTWLTSSLWRGRVIACLLFSGSICAGIGVLQYALGRGEVRWLDLAMFENLGGRVTSTFSNPNILAIFLLVIFGLSLGGCFSPAKSRYFCLIPLALSSACLIFTWSRGAWLGAIAATVFFFLLHSRGTLAALLVSPLAVLGILPWIPSSVRFRFASIGNFAESSSRYRLNTWRGVLRMIRAHPYGIGNGETAFHTVFPNFAVSGTESVMHAHNVFLQVAAENGIAAAGLLIGIFGMLFSLFFATHSANLAKPERAWALGSAATLLSLIVMGMFDHLWYQPTLFYLIWFVAALLVAQAEDTWEGEFYET